jgi:hypothetical protein
MKAYTDPTIETLGTLAELTETENKCGGSGDAFHPQPPNPQLEEKYAPEGECGN